MSAARSGHSTNRPAGSSLGAGKRGKWRLAAGAASLAVAMALAGCAASPEEIHAREWEMAARTDTPQAYETYLRLYPGGPFAPVAEQRVAELSRMEVAAWEVAKRADTEASYEDFLARFPWGRNAAEAETLRAARAAPRLAAEERAAWDDAKRRDFIDGYEA
jgi:hypothetical protein